MILILKFLLLTFLVSGVIIFFLHRALISSTDGAVNRLNEENKKLVAKQEELNTKVREANEELAKKQKEARELANKMRADAEQESAKEKEKIIAKARQEGEEIIAKAQGAKDKIRAELEKENDIRIVRYSMEILNDVLSQKAKGSLNETLTKEFVEKLSGIDMGMISQDIHTVEMISLESVSENIKSQILSIIKQKTGRTFNANASVNDKIGGGIILKFGSMALDGSVQTLIRDKALAMQQQIQAKGA